MAASSAAELTTRAVPARGLGSLTAGGIIALMVLVLTQFLWTRTLPIPSIFNWVDDVLVVALGALALTRQPPRIGLSHGWAWALAGFLFVAALSTFANDVTLLRAVLGIRGVLLYVGLYYAMVTSPLTRDDMRRILAVLLVLMLVQMPFQVVAFGVGLLRFGPDWNELADLAVGTFGTGMANALGLLTLPFIATSFVFWAQGRGTRWLLITGILVVELVLSSARAALVLMIPAVVGVMGLTYGWRVVFAPRRVLGGLAVLALAVGAADLYYRATSGAGVAERFSPSALLQEQLTYNPQGSSRLLYYPVTWGVLTNDAASPLIGLGPGNYASGAGYLTNSPGLASIRDVFGQFKTGRETALNSQLLASLGEFGFVGFGLYCLMIVALARRTLVVRRRLDDPFWRTVLAGIFVGQVLFLVATPLESLWEDQVVAFPFWLVTALVTGIAAEQALSRAAPQQLTSHQ